MDTATPWWKPLHCSENCHTSNWPWRTQASLWTTQKSVSSEKNTDTALDVKVSLYSSSRWKRMHSTLSGWERHPEQLLGNAPAASAMHVSHNKIQVCHPNRDERHLCANPRHFGDKPYLPKAMSRGGSEKSTISLLRGNQWGWSRSPRTLLEIFVMPSTYFVTPMQSVYSSWSSLCVTWYDDYFWEFVTTTLFMNLCPSKPLQGEKIDCKIRQCVSK